VGLSQDVLPPIKTVMGLAGDTKLSYACKICSGDDVHRD
jgi:hypothetical protein